MAAEVRVAIDMRGEIAAGRLDPQRDAVGVRGGWPPLSWLATVAAGDFSSSGVFETVLRFDTLPPAGELAYKFKVDQGRGRGTADDGWEAGRNRRIVLREGSQALERTFGADPDAAPPRRTGRIDVIAPQPSAFVAPREVQVWLPPGYGEAAGAPLRRYPVLYLHDGQNVFDARAAGAEWGVDETAQRLVEAGAVEPFIVVAVSHAGNRELDYTAARGRRPGGALQGGGAPAYARYLVEELKPMIDARYATRDSAGDTAVGGSSLGALVSMWLALHHPQVFGAALVVSPAVWWADSDIVKTVRAMALPQPAPRIWLDMGTAEGEGALAGARALRDALAERGWPVLRYTEAAGAAHDEAAWAGRVEPMLRFLFPPAVLSPPSARPGTAPATGGPAPAAKARGASTPP